MKYTSSILAGLALIAMLIAPSSVRAQAVNEYFDVVIPVFIPCANGGAGEVVLFEGRLHHVMSISMDNNGCYHISEMFQPMGLQGTGQTTGDKYQGTGMTRFGYQDNTTCDGCIYTETMVNNFRLIGPGRDNDFIEAMVIKTTYNICTNESEVTVEHSETDCR